MTDEVERCAEKFINDLNLVSKGAFERLARAAKALRIATIGEYLNSRCDEDAPFTSSAYLLYAFEWAKDGKDGWEYWDHVHTLLRKKEHLN